MDSAIFGENNEIDLLVYYEHAFFNRVYTQQEYRDNREDTFSVSLDSWGGEFKIKNQRGEIRGAGFSMSRISGGSVYNYDHYENQPGTVITMPYFFTGYDFKWWALEAGIGYYLTWIENDPVLYYQPDGSLKQVSGGGMRFAAADMATAIHTVREIFYSV